MADEHEREHLNRLSYAVIGAGFRVHTELGPGMKESSCEDCLVIELTESGFHVAQQQLLPVTYRGRRIARAYRPDLIVEHALAVEVKAVRALLPLHTAQLRSYLKQSKLKLGLLFNFNTQHLRNGIVRVVNGFPD